MVLRDLVNYLVKLKEKVVYLKLKWSAACQAVKGVRVCERLGNWQTYLINLNAQIPPLPPPLLQLAGVLSDAMAWLWMQN